jgi:hypothetical protein
VLCLVYAGLTMPEQFDGDEIHDRCKRWVGQGIAVEFRRCAKRVYEDERGFGGVDGARGLVACGDAAEVGNGDGLRGHDVVFLFRFLKWEEATRLKKGKKESIHELSTLESYVLCFRGA